MKSRERVIRAIEMTGLDRIPISHATLAGAFHRYGDALRRLYEEYPSDCLNLGATGEGEFSGQAGVKSIDAWGSVWVSTTDDYKGAIEEPVLRSWEDFDGFQPPDPIVDPQDLARGRRIVEENIGSKYLVADGDTLWQRMFYLRGYENIMVDLAAHRDKATALRDMILDFMLERMRIWLELEIDAFQVRDDWGTQETLMINPTLWRKFFKPAYREICNLVHDAGRHLWFHSDGAIASIIPDMIEIGVDVINPQVPLVGVEMLGREYGGEVCFLGDVDRQQLLPFGTPEEIERYVKKVIEALGVYDGGYIGRGELAPDVPLENARAMFEAFRRYGNYDQD
jgi:uroporphyrinogen decarboxylase